MEFNNMTITATEKEFLDAIEKQRKEQPELQYQDALKLVASDNPNLVRRYKRAVMTGRD